MYFLSLAKRFGAYIAVFMGTCFLAYFLAGCGNARNISLENSDAGGGTKTAAERITLATWNVQTFFDAHTDGTEYADFKKAGNWGREKYLVRLERLCSVMTALNADVFVLEEIENEAVVLDIANYLAGKNWSKSKKWDYAFFAKDDDSAIGCAVFSRRRIADVTVHSMDIRCQKTAQPQCRPIVRFSVEAGSRQLWILANHWKSKLGANESRIWRQWQESVAAQSIAVLDAVVLCGDFNQDALEFFCDFGGIGQTANTVFRGAGTDGVNLVRLYSPWFTQSGAFSTKIGSYFYQGKWERIDHIFSGGSAKIEMFSPRAEEPWADSDGKPIPYKIYNGNGYSDHLPLMCTVSF